MEYVKPPRLRSGDSVAVVSTSWGGPHVFPHVFGAGIRALTHRFGLRVVEFPTARMAPDDLAADPRARAADLNAAFADTEIAAVICSIGGDDSARILRYLDADVIRSNPKIMMGFSDSTTQLVYAHQLGLVTFNGPAVMAGFAQLGNFAQAEAHIRSMLFEPTDRLVYEPFPHWVNEYAPWNQPESAQPENAGQFGARDLAIVTNMDFGHTDPQWILPLGITAELDCNMRTFALTEAAVT